MSVSGKSVLFCLLGTGGKSKLIRGGCTGRKFQKDKIVPLSKAPPTLQMRLFA